ncbi:hypothetical protein RQP54_18490 [Curvibacter sp. APW13]|uniref:hypothetical protein n=1 Tax=Curvibacter sp. APW13 TaxID=3077236 RepID=UPI0028DE4C5D|nr:hypothetical protein [Curvibacter sp. APW13]MDT8992869.1 hypothetical protein [Curvibacter sp. APW13]
MIQTITRHALLALLLLGSIVSHATDLVWDGKTYLDIGLRMGADTSVVFPEPVEMSAEITSAFSMVTSTTDERILSIRPLQLQEQRVTFIGTKTKTIYLARFSTRAPYSPLYRVKDGTAIEAARVAATAKLSPTGMMKALMGGQPINGVSTRQHKQEIVVGPEYRIMATEIWESPTITGVIGTLVLRPEIQSTTVRPGDISLKIPAFGNLRMMGADRWDLDRDVPSTTVYFVFTK